MAAFALHAAMVIFSAYTVSGVVLAAAILVAVIMRWRIDRALIVPMMGWGAVGVVGMAFALRAVETFSA